MAYSLVESRATSQRVGLYFAVGSAELLFSSDPVPAGPWGPPQGVACYWRQDLLVILLCQRSVVVVRDIGLELVIAELMVAHAFPDFVWDCYHYY